MWFICYICGFVVAGYKKLLRLLISKGAVVDAEAVFGTPLHCAATHGKKEAVKILLKNNANVKNTSHPLSPEPRP